MPRLKLQVKKGDTVTLLAGKDRGKEGKVIQVFPDLKKVVVDKINIRKKHLKPQQRGQQGQIVEFSAPVEVSNVMLVCPHCSKPTRVAHIAAADGKFVRSCKKCNKAV